MSQNNLRYTIGVYNESPEGSLSTSGPALLAQTLAWAVQNDIPFHKVILSLTHCGHLSLNRVLFLLPESRKWEKCLSASFSDLINGVPLYKTLRKRLSYFLPEYYLQAVEKAEKEEHLKETLPVFAKRLNFFYETRAFYKRALVFPFLELFIICTILSFLSIFILPNLDWIFFNFTTHNKPSSSLVGLILMGTVGIWRLFWNIIYIVVLLHYLGRIFARLRRFILMLLGEIFIFIPPFRRQLRDVALLNLASSMASYLELGEDILNAAVFSEKACNHFWLKRKLKRFIAKVERGENWLDAWSSMKLRQNLSECIIRGAAAKEDIVAGFDTISDWLYHKQIRRVKNNAVWFTVIFTGVNALIVFLVMFYVFQLIIQIIHIWT